MRRFYQSSIIATRLFRSQFQIKDDEVPDDGCDIDGDDASEKKKESSHRFVKKRDEDVVDYISGGERIAREMRYVAETTEGERIGDWTPSPTAMRTTRFHKHSGTPFSLFSILEKLSKKAILQNSARFVTCVTEYVIMYYD